jgi:signal transduction histidine kinase
VTNLPECGAGPTVGDAAVAWLVLDGDALPSRTADLNREQCLAVAAALFAAADGRGHPADPAPGLAERLAVVAGRVSPLAEWLASLPKQASVWSGTRASSPEHDDVQFLSRLAAAVVVSGEEQSPWRADQAAAVAEAVVLRGAVQAALSHAELRGQFDRAVAEARLEAMRELAYGAGHEINNPLANIATRAQSLLLEETDPERRRRLSTIVDQSFRARDMIGGLMLFARPPKPRPEAVDVGGIIAAVIETVRGQAAQRGVRLEYSPPPSPLSVFVDRVQIEESLRVVVVNALEAVAAGGRVVLKGTRRSADDGGWGEITVADDGRGMPFDAARRAFDPFFSGREAGRGAGLGLPKAWRLVTLSGGRVLLESRPSQGTRVTILLPETSDVDTKAVSAIA